MSTERNKQAVMTYLTALAHNDVKGMSAVMTDDATWWIAPGTKFSGLHQKADVLANISVLYQNATGGLKLDICDVTAEADRVNVVAKGDLPLKDGRAYQTNYSILFRMRDGKIASGKEFSRRDPCERDIRSPVIHDQPTFLPATCADVRPSQPSLRWRRPADQNEHVRRAGNLR